MNRVFTLGMFAVFVSLYGCGEGRPDYNKINPSSPLPASGEKSDPAQPGPVVKPAASPAPVPPRPATPAFACANPIGNIGGNSKGSLSSGLLENNAGLSRNGWTVDNVQIFIESSDRSEQLLARAFRSQQVLIECQNLRPGSTIAGYAAFPDSVAPLTGQYPGELQITVGLSLNGVASGQAALFSPVFRGMPIYSRIQDWRPSGSSDSWRGPNGAFFKQKIQKLDVAILRPGLTVIQTEAEVESGRGKYRVYTRAEYSL